jgi:hypothetical protein
MTKTYECRCGHLAYKLPKREWLCHCSNPKPKNQIKPLGMVIQPKEINVARMLSDIECRGD